MSDIPQGKYKARAVAGSAVYGTTSAGHDQLTIEMNIPSLGRNVFTYLYFSEKAKPYALARLKALGWDGGPGMETIDKNEVDLQIKYEMWEGKQRMRCEIDTFAQGAQGGQDARSFFKKLSVESGNGGKPTVGF